MSSTSDIVSVQQTAAAILSALQETQAKLVPTDTSGGLVVDTLVQSGFVRVLGVSVMGGSGAPFLHDCAALADASSGNAIYLVPIVPGFYATNMVFKKGLVLKIATGTWVAIMYTRV